MIDREQAERFAATWIESWSRHDIEGILAHYEEDVEWSSPFVVQVLGEPSGILRGKAAVCAYLEHGLSRYPELEFELYGVLCGVRSVTLYYRSVNNLLAAEVFELGPSGRVRRVLCHYSEPAQAEGLDG
ncbi:MAG: nuclear transport factor 2 family protein [Myxococcota bacterium]